MRHLILCALALCFCWAGGSRSFYDASTDDRVYNNSASALANDSGLSMCGWFYIDALGKADRHYFLVLGNDAGNSETAAIFVDDPDDDYMDFFVRWDSENYRASYETATFPATTWTHVCWTYTGGDTANDAKVYLNGVDVSAGINEVSTPSGADDMLDQIDEYTVGADNDDSKGLDGRAAYIHVYDREITEAEVQEIMLHPGSITSGLELYLPLWGESSPEPDLSGSGLSGTIDGATESNDGPPVSLLW